MVARRRTRCFHKLFALGLGCLWMVQASQAMAVQAKVTNGGYMESHTADGKTVVLPLKHTDVDAEVAGFVTSVQVTQHFHNPFQKPIEAVYVFPLPHRAAIYALTITVGKRTIKGLVKKRAEARKVYEQAKAQGRTAALLEQERPNIFTQSVANILPGDQIKVKMRYVEDLAPEDGRYEFSFPMVVGPRYVGGGEALGTRTGSGWGTDSTRIPDASRITPALLQKGLRPGNDIAVRLKINGGLKVRHLQVVTHKASTTVNGSTAFVELDKRDAIPNKDFVVRYQLTGKQPEVSVLTQRDRRGGHFLLMIQPKAQMQQQDIAPREYVFVVDNSGSMSGFPMQQARAVVKRCLSNLTTRETFQIIKFAGYPDQFAPRAVRATPQNIQQGIGYVSQMRGGGGTEFIPALKLALLAPKSKNRSRIVLFITDGYIGYEREVLRFLRQNIKGINLFALGVGSSVNRFLIDGMARIGVGSPFYLLNTEKAQSVVERIFSTISKPALTDISIDWGSLDAEEMTPSAVPDLFGHKPVFVAGRYERGGSGTVTVRGRLAGQPFVRKVPLTLPAQPTSNNTAVAYLWARRQIADQMDVFATEPQRQKEVERSVTQLALSYNLMSRFTSFVAVDSQIRNQGGQQTTVDVPVPLPQGVSPLAAPRGAFVGGMATGGYGRGYGRGAGGVRYRKARRSYPRSQMSYSADALSGLSLDGDASSAAPTRPTPTRRAPVLAKPAKPAEEREDKAKRTTVRVRLSELRITAGSAGRSTLEPKLKKLVWALSARIRSVSPGSSGKLKLRLTLDAAGRVKRLAFVSGTLMLPSLKQELRRLLGTWRLGSLGQETTLVFTLHFG